jgi:hypothetical protein
MCIIRWVRSTIANGWHDFQSIGEARLKRVFHKWMDRLAQCYVAVGGSVEGT